jgi:hypothetical protein
MISFRFERTNFWYKVRQACTLQIPAHKSLPSTMSCLSNRQGMLPFLLQTKQSVAGTAAANSLTAAEDVDKRALRLQVCKLSSTQG